jgi:hypothetical protein
VLDPELGFIIAPNIQIKIKPKLELDAYYYRTDSNGFRNGSVPPTADVIVAGDSQTVGTLDEEHAWSCLLQRNTGYRIYNLGTGGWGPQQYTEALRRFGMKLKPQLVLFAFYEGNDIENAYEFKFFRLSGLPWDQFLARDLDSEDSGGRMPIDPLDTFFRILSRTYVSALLRAAMQASPWEGQGNVRHALVDAQGHTIRTTSEAMRNAFETMRTLNFDELQFYDEGPFRRSVLQSEPASISDIGWTETKHAIIEANRLANAHRARFAVVMIPSKIHVYLEALEFSNQHGLDERIRFFKSRMNVYANLLQDLSSEEDFQIFNLTRFLVDAVKKGKDPYFMTDGHLNVNGNLIIANTLGTFVEDELKQRRLLESGTAFTRD